MRKDTELLKKCLQELERIQLATGMPRSELVTEASEFLTGAMNPKINCNVFIKPGDKCKCGDLATESRYTHWSVFRFCFHCARAYDAGRGDESVFQGGCALIEAGADPEYAIP